MISLLVGALVMEWRYRRGLNRNRRIWLAAHRNWERDPAAKALDSEWYFLGRPPSTASIRQTISKLGLDHAGRPIVVYLGAFEVPPRGDYRFEPALLTPTETTSRAQMMTALIGSLALLAAGNWLLLPMRLPHSIRQWWPVVVIGTVVTAVWFWRSIVRPRYVRIAPGMLQVITYAFGARNPTIRDYPVAPGLLCVLTADWRQTRLHRSTGPHHDQLLIAEGRAGPFVEQLGRAVLSTAPTPPLSNEALLG